MAFTTDYGTMKGEPSDFRKFVDSLGVRSSMEGKGQQGVRVLREGERKFLTGLDGDTKLFEVVGGTGAFSLVDVR